MTEGIQATISAIAETGSATSVPGRLDGEEMNICAPVPCPACGAEFPEAESRIMILYRRSAWLLCGPCSLRVQIGGLKGRRTVDRAAKVIDAARRHEHAIRSPKRSPAPAWCSQFETPTRH